jgi:hypothetical protein
MRFLTSELAGHDLVGLPCLAVEVENKLERRCQPTIPVAGQSWPLVPDVPGKAPPALRAHPVEPAIPVRDDFVVAVDQPEIDQHLAIGGHRQLIEYAAHQGIPINDGVRIVTLVAVGRRCEAQRRLLAGHQCSDHGGIGGITTDHAMRTQLPDVARTRDRIDRRIGYLVGSIVVGISRGLLATIHQ